MKTRNNIHFKKKKQKGAKSDEASRKHEDCRFALNHITDRVKR